MPRERRRRSTVILAAAALFAVAACAHQQPGPAASSTNCLSPTALADARRQIGMRTGDATIKKLDPELRGLLRDLVATAPEDEGRCFPEEVGVIVAFRGDAADLVRVGVAYLRADQHPDGSFLGTGRIKTALLPSLAAIDHLIAVDGGGRYTPE